MIKWLLILLLIGCSSTITKQRLCKDEVVSVYELKNGYCEYAVKPRQNYTIYTTDECGKYRVGDSLYHVETYTEEKK